MPSIMAMHSCLCASWKARDLIMLTGSKRRWSLCLRKCAAAAATGDPRSTMCARSFAETVDLPVPAPVFESKPSGFVIGKTTFVAFTQQQPHLL